MKSFSKSFWGIILFFIVISIYLGQEKSSDPIKDLIFSDFVKKLENGNFKKIYIKHNSVTSVDKENKCYRTIATPYMLSPVILSTLKTNLDTEYLEDNPWISFIRDNLIAVLTLILFLFLAFGKLPGLRSTNFKVKLNENFSFDDIAGADEAKEELEEIIEILKNPQKFASIGAKVPKGIIIHGEPGTGKTLLAKAIACEAGCNFFHASGASFDEIYVGVGASRIRELFKEAMQNAPCIIFIDEIDCLGQRRNKLQGNVGDQTLNEFLSQLDGLIANKGVIVIGATNRLDSIDPALLRPGRLGDRIIYIPLPSMHQREAILKVHAKKVKSDENIDLAPIAKRTFGFSGASLAKVINEAALIAVKNKKEVIDQNDLFLATEKVHLGPISKTHIMSFEEKQRTAYHESGHAIVSKQFDLKNKIHQITVLPRANALGYVVRIPNEEKDAYSKTKSEYLADIKVALAGYASEEIMYGKENVSSGPSNDLMVAKDIIRSLIMNYGMNNEIGLMSFQEKPGQQFPISNDSLSMIESEIRNTLKSLYQDIKKFLEKNKSVLEALASLLLTKEIMDASEVESFFIENELKK